MNRFLGIIIFGSLLVTSAYAELPGKLFGVKLYDHINNYAKPEDGEISEARTNNLIYKDHVLNNLQKNSAFESYYVRTDSYFKILSIGGRKYYYDTISSFDNACLKDKNKFIKKLSILYDVNSSKFKNKFYKSRKSNLVDDSSIDYRLKGKKITLSLYCVYVNRDENLMSVLFLNLLDAKYSSETISKIYTQIKPFDNDFIKLSSKGL